MSLNVDASSGCGRVSGTFIAFVILLILAITKINVQASGNNNSNYNNNNNADALSDKSQVPSWPSSSPSSSPQPPLMMTSEIVISVKAAAAAAATAPSNFNKNSLQQEQQQQEEEEDERAEQHFNADNNKRLRGQNAEAAVAAAKGNNVSGAAAIAAIAATAATDDARNGFHDKINISNQRNEFNGRPETTAATETSSSTLFSSSSSTAAEAAAATTTAAALKRQVAASSFSERVELQESSAALLSPDKRQKLLLHRQKRYLLFPEGSSFQLVFDLIIPIVDYTNFAIMGITCAIAWELPSKPPSEIIENFRDKLNDGTFGLSRRRNDTTEDIKYVNANDDDYGGGGGEGGAVESQSVGEYGSRVPATVAAGLTSAMGNFENSKRKPTQTDTYYKKYNNNYKALYNPFTMPAHNAANSPAALNAYYAPRRPQKYFEAGGDFSDFSELSADKSSGGWKTFNSPPTPPSWHTKAYSKYHNSNNDDGSDKNSNGGISGYADKQKYANSHWQSGGAAKWRTGAAQTSYVGPDKYYRNKQPWTHAKYAAAGANAGGGSWDKDNWWQRNKQRVQQSWRNKQQEWEAPYEHNLSSKPTAATPIYSAPRTGRNRKILTAPPKHHIYPVFGKRRRRRSSPGDDGSDDFERNLERLHLRAQLQSRQKLYRKIEQLYKVRGHNGTACVLRALCETSQRRQHRKPQSFLTELLRAIFVLPEDDEDDDEFYHGYTESQYRMPHAAAENCVQRFADCGHSFWNEAEMYKM